MPRCEIALREKIIEGKKQTLTPWIMKTQNSLKKKYEEKYLDSLAGVEVTG